MQNQGSNRAIIQVQINSLERTKERLLIRVIYSIFYGTIMGAFLIIFLVMGNPYSFVFILFILLGIGVCVYNLQRIKAIDYDIEYLKRSIQ